MSVVSLSDAKAHLHISTSVSDAELQKVIDSSEAAVVAMVGPISAVTVTDTVDCPWSTSWPAVYSQSLVLKTWPVISLTSVTGYSGATVSVSDLDVSSRGLIRYKDRVSVFFEPWYSVVYQAGRATLPTDLRLGVLAEIRLRWRSQRGAGTRHPSGADGPDAQSTAADNAASLLRPYLLDRGRL